MNRKDSLAILGELLLIGDNVFPSITNETACLAFDYLLSLKLPYTFVRDILNDDYGSPFYHMETYLNAKEPFKVSSDYDYVEFDPETGRLGIWCEVDGFIAWLDEYETVWTVDSREEVAERERKYKEHLDKIFKPFLKKAIEKIYSKDNSLENSINWNNGTNTIKIAKFESPGLAFYTPNPVVPNKDLYFYFPKRKDDE